MIKKIILFIESPYSTRDHKRFGVEILTQNGFQIEIWDFSNIFYPNLDLKLYDNFEFAGLKKFYSKNEVIDAISKLTSEDMIITWFHYRHFEYLWIYRSISKWKIPYSVLQFTAVPYFGKSLMSKVTGFKNRPISRFRIFLKRLYTFIVFRKWWIVKKYFYFFIERIFVRIPFRFFGVRAAFFWFAGTELSMKVYKLPVDCNTKIVSIHAFDYDLFLERKDQKTVQWPKTAIFLDEYLPFNEEFIMFKETQLVSADKYYSSLCQFFDLVEREQGLQVEIAAHPRSHYDRHPDYYGARNTYFGKTIDLVKDARLVITHCTTSLNYAVLYYKPVIFVITDEMVGKKWTGFVYDLAASIGKVPINIDQNYDIDWGKELTVDKKRYDEFKNLFIKKAGTKELNSWQIVADSIKGLA